MKNKKKTQKTSVERPPIVAVLGHVDHGKTTLLDCIRKTSVARKEAGGITQGIGASVVETKDKKSITFIDTPGHAAFEKMRSRGAKVSDIAVLVVAANDGVKPQTVEAIKHIEESKTPFLIAITKSDLDSANPKSVKEQLGHEGITLEGKGGDVPVVLLSGKTGEGIDELLETLVLMAEMNEITGAPNAALEAVVIEAKKDKRGVAVSVVVRQGALRVGSEVKADNEKIKIRGLFDVNEKPVKEIFPGEPAVILGFSELPEVGTLITEAGGKVIQKAKQKIERQDVGEEEISVVLKAQNSGSLEALKGGLSQKAVIIGESVGNLIESDVFIAKAANAYVLVFESKVPKDVRKLAQTEGVEIFEFDIIYKVFEKVEELLKMREKVVSGEAEILATFPFNKKQIAGCRVKKGEIKKGDKLTLVQGGKEIATARAVSLKKQKEDIGIAKEGEECGILLSPQLDFKVGDMLVSVAK